MLKIFNLFKKTPAQRRASQIQLDAERAIVDEKIKQGARYIHYLKYKRVYQPWELISEDNIPNLTVGKPLVLQILKNGKDVEYAGYGKITEIERIENIELPKRSPPVKRKEYSVEDVSPKYSKYTDYLYKVELDPVSTTNVFSSKTLQDVLDNIDSTGKRIYFIKINKLYKSNYKEPYINFDLFDENKIFIPLSRGVVSFDIKMEKWMIPWLKKYNKSK